MDFPDTRWTLIAHLSNEEKAGLALNQLCAAYWQPIYVYLIKTGRPHAQAQDLTQDFLEMVVRRRLLERADPVQGSLRSWLLAALRHFLANASRHDARQKRGAGAPALSLDCAEVLPELAGLASQSLTPDEAFDRAWLSVLLRRVLDTLQAQYRQAGREGDFMALLPWLLEDGSVPQIEAAAQAGLTAANFRVQLHRLRGRYREILWQTITATLEREEDYEAELAYLFRITRQEV